MKPLLLSQITSIFALLLIAAAPEEKQKGGAGQGGQVEAAVVPPSLFNVWLCRPGAGSVTVSVLAWEDMEAFIEYGDGLKTAAKSSTSIVRAGKGRCISFFHSVWLHGHDPLFVKEELDGIVYQDVPQPGHPSGGTRSAEEYGYGGVILGSAGHVRVTVEENQAQVDYVRSIVPGVTRSELENGAVEHSYTVKPR